VLGENMSLKEITFELRLFESKADRDRSRRCILWLMEALCQVNKTYLAANKIPPLYESNVYYKFENSELWKDVYNILEDGHGDCEDLSCWRVAELQLIGIPARPYIKWRKQNGIWIYHALVWHPGNKIEDPSLALGMHRGRMVRKPVFVKP
jgi:hypothetical protein